MQGFESPGSAQRFLSAILPFTTPSIFSAISFPVATLRLFRADAADAWKIATKAAA